MPKRESCGSILLRAASTIEVATNIRSP